MISFIRASLLAATGFLLASCSKSERTADTLVVGMELEYPPFETVDDKGNPAGVSIDLAKALAQHLGRKLLIQDYKFKGLPAAVSSGKIDLVISSMTPTDLRRKEIAFSDPYATIGLALLVQKSSPDFDTGSLNHSGITIAVKSGTTGESFADHHLPEANLLRLDHAGACAIEVAQGKADAFIYDQISVLEFAENHPDTTRALPAPIQTENWAIGISKGNEELRREVNAFLEEFRASGGFDRLAEQHLQTQKARFDRAGVPFIF
jgi:polar amino acid transport system substrate-binding protein